MAALLTTLRYIVIRIKQESADFARSHPLVLAKQSEGEIGETLDGQDLQALILIKQTEKQPLLYALQCSNLFRRTNRSEWPVNKN
jgi:hypothetical protein